MIATNGRGMSCHLEHVVREKIQLLPEGALARLQFFVQIGNLLPDRPSDLFMHNAPVLGGLFEPYY